MILNEIVFLVGLIEVATAFQIPLTKSEEARNMEMEVLLGKRKDMKLTIPPMEYLVQHLNESLDLESNKPYHAMLAVDRGHYTTFRPYANCITNIGYGAHMLAPFQQAMILDDLGEELIEGKKVLDIGSGNGYFTALMAWCVGKTGKVIGIEHIPQLVQRATHNVICGNPEFVKDGRIKFVLGDGRKGYLPEAPYDVIHVGGAIEDIPEGLISQLKVNGTLFATFGPTWTRQDFRKVTKINDTYLEEDYIRGMWNAPIIDKMRQLRRNKNGKTVFYGYTTVGAEYTPIHGKKSTRKDKNQLSNLSNNLKLLITDQEDTVFIAMVSTGLVSFVFTMLISNGLTFIHLPQVREYEDWRHESNDEMIEALKKHGHIVSKPVEAVMRTIDRRRFIERPVMNNPYWDAPQSLGYGSVMSSPKVHAQALEILQDYLKPGAKVLDIGSGSGYLTACMAHMVGPTGKVVAIEHIDELTVQANKSMHTFYPTLMENGRVQFVVGDGRNGYKENAPYDVIYVGGAVHHYPFNLVEQLSPCSRIYIPVGLTTETQNWETIDKFYDGECGRKKIMKTAFPYLKDATRQMKIHLANFIYPC